MCTAVSWKGNKAYFGRNLDLEGSFGEGVVVLPRNAPIAFRREGLRSHGYAMIGMAVLAGKYPLFFDAVNEYGLGMASLNFPKNACYLSDMDGMHNVAPFELIPYVLGICKTADEAKNLLGQVNVINKAFGDGFPLTPLHWMISDGKKSLTVEPMADGLKLYENPVHVLTNNPPFDKMMSRLPDYMSLTPYEPTPRFGESNADLRLENYSRGMGSMGLPGDWSSASRFVRAVFIRENIVAGERDIDDVNAFFHILSGVSVPRGCMRLKEGVYEETIYSSCCDLADGIYYYTTYSHPAVACVKLHESDLDGTMPAFHALET